ncbi:tRNA (cytidine(56)-2'-O)-methyltransferase [Halobacteriales archaeon QH_7_69_31]|nr:MAG: tRNA (cytidine(56)-2'-O)-methyltransferase [Halobacteriales archaeon QH_7_69_31]
MQGTNDVVVLRLGHRPGRDERMTTHVGLTARALGADRVVIAGEAAEPADVRDAHDASPLLVVVGSEKVPFDVYEAADHNVAVTSQPHSEVAGLAVFLDRLFEGRELDRDWRDATHRVVPQATGKRVEPVEGDAGERPPE